MSPSFLRIGALLAILVGCGFATIASAEAPAAKLTVHVGRPGIKVSPTLYGIFFEEINRAGEGGLYAEMVSNRSLEDSSVEPAGWFIVKADDADGAIALDSAQPLNENNPHSLRIDARHGRIGAANSGFGGISVQSRGEYVLSLYAHASDGFDGPLTVSLENSVGRSLASAKIQGLSSQWQKFTCALKAAETDSDPSARLVISISNPGTIWVDVVSLFPKTTWKERGLRADVAQMVANLKPGFFRFPGGCWVEGETLNHSYHWKDTIGGAALRKNNYNLWKYYCANGLGFHEYLQLCEDIGAAPLFVINCGMSHKRTVPISDMQPWVQDAIDAIEYANGPTDSKWGAERAKNGHPASFNLKFIEVGNENGGQNYNERYALFYDSIKKSHPEIQIVADFWQGAAPKSRPVEILDEHYYNAPGFFIANADRFDRYDRKGPKIYVGEYAVTRDCGGGNLRAAVAEAAFMTGLERNSDIVVMASYAPLLCNVDYKIWNPNAINFDSTRVFGTPSYYVQQMFAQNRADVILPIDLEFSAPEESSHGAVGLGTWNTHAEYKDFKVTEGDQTLLASDFKNDEGWTKLSGEWSVQDGALRQTSDRPGAFIAVGDPAWSDYTISLKARKLEGREGFMVRFNSPDNDRFTMWNIGGYRNQRHQIEWNDNGGMVQVGRSAPGSIETGRWYDIRIELSGRQIRCFLDGTLVHDATYPKRAPLYAAAGAAGNDIVLKVVNVSSQPQTTSIRIDGAAQLKPKASETLLTSDDPRDENSLAQPTRVYPMTRSVDCGPEFECIFAPNSITILRLSKS